MHLFGKKRAIGLDVGQGAVKVIRLAAQGRKKAPAIEAAHTLDRFDEGLLGPEEVRKALPEWLEQHGLDKGELLVAVPQYLATTQISDFPETGDRELSSMVAYETEQLAGLSEEPFLFGFYRLPPDEKRKNPVFIGICRQSVLEETANQYRELGLWVRDLAMSGLAAANAYLALYPELAGGEAPQVLLDIGTENTTLVVLADGLPIFVSSLLFGGQKFNQALARQLNVSEDEVEQTKRNARLDPSVPNSPLMLAAKALENELRTALEQWRSQDNTAIAKKKIQRLAICGGGARMLGLAEFLGRILRCESTVVGVPLPPSKDGKEAPAESAEPRRDPAMMTAYGLALQGLGRAPAEISLAPREIQWLNRRRHAVGYLAAATTLASILVAGGMFLWYRSLKQEQTALNARLDELGRCEQLIPKLDDLTRNIAHREKMLLPFVDKGNRAYRFLGAIQELARVRGPHDWMIYLADYDSYQEGKPKKAKTNPEKPAAVGPVFGMMPTPENTAATTAETAMPDPYPVKIVLPNVHPLTTMVAAGYTRFVPTERLKAVKKLVEKLNGEKGKPTLFKGVDILVESEKDARADIFLPWERLFRRIAVRGGDRYQAFLLRLPFAETDVVLPENKKAGKP